MATLTDNQQAMVDLLASGSGIPASASRLAHAMHDLIDVLYVAFPNLPRTKDEDWLSTRGETRLTITPDVTLDIKDIIRAVEANSPGLNDKALAGDIEACRPKATPAERRVKELENTVKQLRASNAKLRAELNEYTEVDTDYYVDKALDTGRAHAELGMRYDELVKILAFYGVDDIEKARAEYLKYNSEPEQAGCRKDDVQVCQHDWSDTVDGTCQKCGTKL